MARFTKILLWAGVAIVAGLLGLNAYIALKPSPKPSFDKPLTALLPPAPAGWTAKDMDIASTPEQRANIEGVLHFDDCAYRLYGNGRTLVDVYLAYWKPGRFSPSKVGSHSPDTCWVRNGWDRVNGEKDVVWDVGGGTLKPMSTGEFSKDNQKTYVLFWHLVGGTSVNYNLLDWESGIAGRIQRFPAMASDFSKYGLDQRQEQLVVRISANMPMTELWKDPSFKELMAGIARSYGLYAKPPVGAESALPTSSAPGNADEVRAR